MCEAWTHARTSRSGVRESHHSATHASTQFPRMFQNWRQSVNKRSFSHGAVCTNKFKQLLGDPPFLKTQKGPPNLTLIGQFLEIHPGKLPRIYNSNSEKYEDYSAKKYHEWVKRDFFYIFLMLIFSAASELKRGQEDTSILFKHFQNE